MIRPQQLFAMLRLWSNPTTVLEAIVEYYFDGSCTRALVLQCHYYTGTPLFHSSTKVFLQRDYLRTPVRWSYYYIRVRQQWVIFTAVLQRDY
eukprot:5974376-Pyramimonas_sp.AAC.1